VSLESLDNAGISGIAPDGRGLKILICSNHTVRKQGLAKDIEGNTVDDTYIQKQISDSVRVGCACYRITKTLKS
jgi:hypothetical protein